MSTSASRRSAPPERVHLVDATLREGEQTPGVWLSPASKLALVDELAAIGLELLDACVPAVSEEEQRFLRESSARGTRPTIGASLRLDAGDVDLAADCGCRAAFLITPASEIQRRHRLRLRRAEVEDRVRTLAERCQSRGVLPQLVLEDASRATRDDLAGLVAAGSAAGIRRFFLCDTVGVWTPSAAAAAVRRLRRLAGPEAEIGIHCHNDFGMATANTIAAIEAGARWPTVTVNGIGERAGHASFAEVALACSELLGLDCGVEVTALDGLARSVEAATGIPIAVQAPILGATAFRHESGMHVHGILREPTTYEPLAPERLGRRREIVVGKHSGRSLLRAIAESEDLEVNEEGLVRALALLKAREPSTRAAAFAEFRAERDRYLATALGLPVEAARRALLDAGAQPRVPRARVGVLGAT
ncbi:MAG: hypothetical protein U0610_31155 [bacterium]